MNRGNDYFCSFAFSSCFFFFFFVEKRSRREIIFGVFLPILLPRFFGLDGVLYSFPVADVLTFILTVIIAVRIYRELSTGKDALAGAPAAKAVKAL